MKGALAFDTSNYTTSAAFFSPERAAHSRKLLEVPSGALGLRQQDALFQHIRAMPAIVEKLCEPQKKLEIAAVGASTAPRETEDSYMPCFLAGKGHGEVMARTLGVPFYGWSHQQGHLAAAAWSAGHQELLDRSFLAWHLSGGTTELLLTAPAASGSLTIRKIGGTNDLSAGQLVDRTGLLLGLDFPAGKALDALSRESMGMLKAFPVKVSKCVFSLSGVENKVKVLAEAGEDRREIADYTLRTLAFALCEATTEAQKDHPGLPVLCSGGVAANTFLRQELSSHCGALFSAPEYASDNAMGTAILTYRAWEARHE